MLFLKNITKKEEYIVDETESRRGAVVKGVKQLC